MKILIAEDNSKFLRNIKNILKKEKFYIDYTKDGLQAFELAEKNYYDLLILDNVLPHLRAKTICLKLRKLNKKMPILILSILADIDQKVELLEAGADDYLVKPFDEKELIARIRALLRRPIEIKGDILEIDDLILDSRLKKVSRIGIEVKLTKKEYTLLEYLLKNKDIVLSRKMIIEHVWDMETDPFSNTVESHILSLRKKIGLKNKRKLIRTISGMGYKISLK